MNDIQTSIRSLTSHAEISYVSTENKDEAEFANEDVVGSHSTKVILMFCHL